MRTPALIAAVLAALAFTPVIAEEESAVDPQHTWDLTELYPSVEAWEQARDEVLAEFDKIEERRGTLGDSADSLYQAYRHVSDTLKKAGRVFVYSGLNADEDLRVTETQERRQLGQIMFARFNEATAWMQPEIISVGREVIESYIHEDERLAPFAFQLDDALRNAPHTLGEEAEQTLAYFTQAFGSPNNTYPVDRRGSHDRLTRLRQGAQQPGPGGPQAGLRQLLEQVAGVPQLRRPGPELALPDPGGAREGA